MQTAQYLIFCNVQLRCIRRNSFFSWIKKKSRIFINCIAKVVQNAVHSNTRTSKDHIEEKNKKNIAWIKCVLIHKYFYIRKINGNVTYNYGQSTYSARGFKQLGINRTWNLSVFSVVYVDILVLIHILTFSFFSMKIIFSSLIIMFDLYSLINLINILSIYLSANLSLAPLTPALLYVHPW